MNTEYGYNEQVPETVFDPEIRIYRTALRLAAKFRIPDKKRRANGRALWTTHIIRMPFQFRILY